METGCAEKTPLDRPCTTNVGLSCCPCKKLTALDDRIADMEMSLATLRHQRIPLKFAVNHIHDALLSRLPAELVSQIFLFCTPTMVDACHTSSYNGMSAEPLSLGAVCREWRTIAWATPQLWSSISIDIIRSGLQRLTPIIKEWLDRSRELPLAINVFTPRDRDDIPAPMSTEITPLLDLLCRHSWRWQHVSFELPHSYILRMCDNKEIEPPAALQSLHIHRTDLYPPSRSPVLHLSSRHSPRLVAVCVLDFQYLDVGWENLTYVRIGEGLSIAAFFKLLECALKLRHCEVWIKHSDSGEYLSQRRTTHHQLRSLRLGSFVSLELAKSFVDRVSFPALQDFDYSDHLFPLLSNGIIDFLSRTKGNIQKLSLWADDAQDNRMLDILTSTPSLTELKLRISQTSRPRLDLMSNLFKKLSASKIIEEAGDNDKPLFLPRLGKLTVEGSKPFSWYSIPAIFETNADRTYSSFAKFRPLRSLTLVLNAHVYDRDYMFQTDGLGIENVRQFIKLRDEGISLKILKQDAYGGTCDLISKYVEEWFKVSSSLSRYLVE